MLMLADGRIERFWEITSPSALLVVLGMICIHVERAFAVDAGPFSRAKFGRAFFQAGHVSLAAGLALLIGGHVSGWFYDAWFAELNWFAKPAVATQTNLKLIALMLSLGGVYSYLYSQLVVAQRGRYTASAVLSLVWSAMVVVDLLNIPLTMEVLALGASIAALLASVSSLFVRGEMDEVAETKPSPFDALFEPLRGSGLRLAGGFNALTLALCVALYLRARSSVGLFDYEFSFAFVVAVVLGGVASWMASLSRVAGQGRWNLQFVAVYALLALAAGLSLAGVALSPIVLAGEMLVPLGLAIYGATCRQRLRACCFPGRFAAHDDWTGCRGRARRIHLSRPTARLVGPAVCRGGRLFWHHRLPNPRTHARDNCRWKHLWLRVAGHGEPRTDAV
jgi:hypothetical protein